MEDSKIYTKQDFITGDPVWFIENISDYRKTTNVILAYKMEKGKTKKRILVFRKIEDDKKFERFQLPALSQISKENGAVLEVINYDVKKGSVRKMSYYPRNVYTKTITLDKFMNSLKGWIQLRVDCIKSIKLIDTLIPATTIKYLEDGYEFPPDIFKIFMPLMRNSFYAIKYDAELDQYTILEVDVHNPGKVFKIVKICDQDGLTEFYKSIRLSISSRVVK